MRVLGIQVKLILFDVLPVIPFVARHAEEPFLENRIAAIPEREGEADHLMPVTDPGQPVFIPSIRFGSRMVVREVFPGCTIGAVVLTHCAPGTLTEIRPPALPMLLPPGILIQPMAFSSYGQTTRLL